MSESAEDFWVRVNTLIKTKCTKQQSVSEQCGISYQTFRGWVTRKVFPDALQTVRIAQALDTSVEFLVTGVEVNRYKDELDSLKATLLELATR